MAITYRIGDATQPEGGGTRIIVHVCNDSGAWGRGFVMAISRRWPAPEARYRAWFLQKGFGGRPFGLGEVQFVKVEDQLFVANLIGQHGVRGRSNPAPIRYEAVRQGLRRVGVIACQTKASIHMPRIGCGLAGGNWDLMGPIIETELSILPVTIYDCPENPLK